MPLNARQQRFVEEYLIDLNATQAAIRAGYSERSAAVIGHENLRKPKIMAELAKARAEQSKRVQIDQDWVLGKLVENVERAMQAEPVRDREGNETGDYTYQGSVANRALELVGKHLGMFPDRHEHTGKGGGPIEHAYDLGGLSTGELARLETLLGKATVLN